MILGSDIDGHRGQSMTFHARDRVRFVSSSHERYYPASVSAELDPAAGFIFNSRHLPKVRRSLAAAGVPSYKERHYSWSMLYDLEVPQGRRNSVPADELSLQVDGGAVEDGRVLLDRIAATGFGGPAESASEVVFDVRLDRPRAISGLWLTSRDSKDLPASFTVSTSMDGRTFRPALKEYENILPTYVAGNRVYMMGYRSRVDLRFESVEARFVRIGIRQGKKSSRRWKINEVFLFEEAGPAGPVSEREVEEIADRLGTEEVDFTAADRWLSARLARAPGSLGGSLDVFPVSNPRHPRSVISRTLTPRPGLAIIVERAVAEECRRVLTGKLPPGTSLDAEEFPHYTLFSFRGPASAFAGAAATLEWNGHVILAADTSNGD